MKRTTHDCDVCKKRDIRPSATVTIKNGTIYLCEECKAKYISVELDKIDLYELPL